jgi:hypothetical protein
MRVDGNEVHADVEEARAGYTPNVTRWVLIFGLLGAIVLLTIIWVTGALVTGPSKSQNADEGIRQAEERTAGSHTDSIVGDHADQMKATSQGQSTDPQNMPNPNAGK